MKRLTKYSEINKDYITPHCDNFNCNGCCRDCDYEQVIINKLAEYENTGLEPNEIEKLKHDLAVRDRALDLACKKIEELRAENADIADYEYNEIKTETRKKLLFDQAEKELKGEK